MKLNIRMSEQMLTTTKDDLIQTTRVPVNWNHCM